MSGSRQIEFPQVFAAVREADAVNDSPWRIGDALLAECGPPGAPGVNNGSTEKLRKVASALKKAGFARYSHVYLRKLRDTAAAFPPDKRLSGVSWSVHLNAGDLQTLHDAQMEAKAKAKLTVSYVKGFRERQKKKNEEKNRRDHPSLNGREPTNPALEQAKERFRKAAANAQELANNAKKAIAPHIDNLSVSERTELFGLATDPQHAWAAIADMVVPPSSELRAAE